MRQLLSFFVSVLFTGTLFAQTGQCGFYIRSGFDSECIITTYRSEKPDGGEGVHEEIPCLLACTGSTVHYDVAGNSSGFNFEWQVAGAESHTVSANGLHLTVHWSEVATEGLIILTGTDANDNVCVEEICIQLVEKPVASFTSSPNLNTTMYGGYPCINVCNGQEIQFINTSTSSADAPITGYFWSIGNNTYSTENINIIANHGEYGDYVKVILEVRNECGCTDTYIVVVHISKFPTLKVDCYGTACEGNEATYTVLDEVCDEYLWSVEGGSIVSGEGSQTVTVAWNEIVDGYGYLGLDGTHCGQDACPNLTYLPIPVIADNVPIEGPAIVCAGEIYSFKLPLWASTEYDWSWQGNGVIPHVSGHPHQLLLEFTEEGTVVISCHYQNDFLNCSGNAASLTVQVKKPYSINVQSSICQGESIDLKTEPESEGTTWEILNEDMQTVTMDYFINTPGSYTIKASNPIFCSDLSKSIIVNPAPSIDIEYVSNIANTWVDKICPNSGYLFSLPEVDDAYYVHWELDCDSEVEPNCAPDNAYDGLDYNALFTGTVYDIKLFYVDKLTGCISEPYTHELNLFVPDPIDWEQTPSEVCANSEFQVSVAVEDNVLYEWSVDNSSIASISGERYAPATQVQTNAFVNDFNLIVKRTYCGTHDENTKQISTKPYVIPDFNLPDELCQGVSATISPIIENPNIEGTWNWYVNGQLVSSNVGTANDLQYTFNQSGNVVVKLSYSNGCEEEYEKVKSFYINPKPEVNISKEDGSLLKLSTSIQEGNYTYLWQQDGVGNIGQGNPLWVNYPTSTPAIYHCIVTNQNTGCVGSDSYTYHIMTPVPGCLINESNLTLDNVDCETARLSLSNYNSSVPIHWNINDISSIESQVYSGENNHILTITFNQAGTYQIWTEQEYNNCKYRSIKNVAIPLIPKIGLGYSCVGNNLMEVAFTNVSSYLSGVQIQNVSWKIDGNPTTSPVNKPNGEYQVEMEITYLYNNNFYTCSVQKTAVVNRGNANFTANTAPFCAETPIEFTSNSNNIVSYEWAFTLNNQSLFENLSSNPTISFPVGNYNALLKVQDANGCWAQDYQNIEVSSNTLEGNIDAEAGVHCMGTDWNLNYPINVDNNVGNDITFDWSCLEWIISDNENNVNPYIAHRTGTYQVMVSGSNHCKYQSDFVNITFKNTPVADITGNDQFCENESVQLSGFCGLYDYQWFIDGNLYANTGNLNIEPDVLSPGNHTVTLEVSNGDCSTSEDFNVSIKPKPSKPNLLLGNNRCIHQPPVDILSSSGSVYWNTGDYTSHLETYNAGFHSAYRIHPVTGCKSDYQYIEVPKAPDFSELMTGCYDFCETNLPQSILGLTGYIHQWSWFLDNSILLSGNDIIQNLPVPQWGKYHLWTKYIEGCTQESDELIINEADTCYCELTLSHRPPICHTEKCDVIFDLPIEITNLSESDPAILTELTMTNGTILNSSGFVYTSPLSTSSGIITFIIDDFTPAVADLNFTFTQNNKEFCKISWHIDLSEQINECIKKCGKFRFEDFNFLEEISNTTISYFKFNLHLGEGLENVQIEPEQGQVYFPDYDINSGYMSGMFGISSIILQTMAEANQEICLTVYGCREGDICRFEGCIPAKILWELVQNQMFYMQKKPNSIEDVDSRSDENLQFILYPNPANTILNIESKGNNLQSYAISNLAGQVLLEGSEKAIDIQPLAKGTYLIRLIDSDNNVSYLKFVKQ